MPISKNLQDRDRESFKQTAGDETARRVCVDTSGGAVLVDPSGTSGVSINEYDEVSSVASSATSTVVSYTVPSNKELSLQMVEFSGNNVANYFIEIDSTKEANKRTWFGGALSGEFNFNNLIIDENLVVRLRVENFRPSAGDFEGRILGALNDK